MKKFILTPVNDPRCIEFYEKAFPELTPQERESLRSNWVAKNVTKK